MGADAVEEPVRNICQHGPGQTDRTESLRTVRLSGRQSLSLKVQFMETQDGADVCSIESGGNNAIFRKINTFGESAFLKTLEIATTV